MMASKPVAHGIVSFLLTAPIISFLQLHGSTTAENIFPNKNNFSFSRDHVSIWFFPPLEDSYRYRQSNLEGMIKLVSKKFGGIAIDNAPIHLSRNLNTLDKIDNKVVSIPLVVAQHNNRSTHVDRMQVMVSFDLSPSATFKLDKNTTFVNSFKVAKHYADKANDIYPRTVDTLVLHHDDYLRVINEKREGHTFIPNQLQSVWETLKRNNSFQYKLGMTISLDLCGSTIKTKISNSSSLLSQIVNYMDLLIPVIYAEPVPLHDFSPNEEHSMQMELLGDCEKNLKTIKPEIEVIPFVICNTPKSDTPMAMSNFFSCWQSMVKWAQRENRNVIMYEAFDQNEADYVRNVGWWRLKDNAKKFVKETSFLEKFQEIDLTPSTVDVNNLTITAVYFDHRARHQFLRRLTSYSDQEVGAMLEVISTRFSTAVTGKAPFLYRPKSTTKNVTWIPHLVARFNHEMTNASGSKPLSVILTYYRPDNTTWYLDPPSNNSLLNLEMALKVAKSSNEIYNETVSTLVYDGLRGDKIDARANFIAWKDTLISGLGNLSLKSGFRLGVFLESTLCRLYNPIAFKGYIHWINVFIVDISRSDVPTTHSLAYLLRTNLVDGGRCVKKLRKTFPEVEVMLAVNCSGFSRADSPETMAVCAQLVNEWGKENQVKVIISQAFDIPVSTGNVNSVADPNGGWWELKKKYETKITKDSFVEKLEKYFVTDVNRSDNTISPPPQIIVEKEPTEESSTISFVVWIAVGLGFVLLLILVSIQTIKLLRKEALLSRIEMTEFYDGVKVNAVNPSLPQTDIIENTFMGMKYDAKKFEIRKREFQFDVAANTVLGKGNYGVVHKMFVAKFAKEVAVKVPHSGCSKQTLKSLLSEIKIMSFVGDHEHVVRFLGSYTNEIQNGIVYIVTDLCRMGSLQSHLDNMRKMFRENKTNALTELLRFCGEIAAGMTFIGEKGVIHGDLSTRNVLLDENANCKISDFGLSRKLYQYNVYTKTQPEELPWRWLAIETLKRMEFSKKSDVWAFGVTIWEIFSFGDLPYPGQVWDWDFVDKLEGGLRMKKPEVASDDVYSKMVDCWNIEPAERPSFDELVSFFRLPGNEYINM